MEGIKLIIVGAPNVGKTAFVIQCCYGVFIDNYDPTISDSYRKIYDIDKQSVMVEFLDISLQTEFEAMKELLYKQCDGALILYSITDYESFSDVPKIINDINEVRKNCDLHPPPMLIFANKCDLIDQKKVSSEHAKELERELNISVIEGSNKQNEVVSEAVKTLARMIIKVRNENGDRDVVDRPTRRRRCIIL